MIRPPAPDYLMLIRALLQGQGEQYPRRLDAPPGALPSLPNIDPALIQQYGAGPDMPHPFSPAAQPLPASPYGPHPAPGTGPFQPKPIEPWQQYSRAVGQIKVPAGNPGLGWQMKNIIGYTGPDYTNPKTPYAQTRRRTPPPPPGYHVGGRY